MPSTQSLNFLKIIFFVHTNLDFIQLNHVKASYYPLFMTSMLVWPKSYTWSESKLPRYIKTFDKVWHEGLLFKPEYTGISTNLLSLLKSFLNNRILRVVLNSQCSNWSSLLAGIPQGSILGPLLCIYIYIYIYIYIDR